MADRKLWAQITEPGHPLQGAPVSIRWGVDSDDGEFVAVDVKVLTPPGVGSRWVPVQLLDQYIGPGTDEAA